LELLAEASVPIPEIGTLRAEYPPIVILTSNRTRDLHDALKRRFLYHWIDYPDVVRAADIIRRRVPAAGAAVAEQVAGAIARIRTLDLQKPPGVAEAINWVAALDLLGITDLTGLDPGVLSQTLGTVAKYREDLELIESRGSAWLAGAP
jgi:MoxR-like ATPase